MFGFNSIPSQEPLPDPNVPPAFRTFTYAEVAAMLKVTPRTLFRWVKEGRVQSPSYVGSLARFTRDQVDKMRRGTDRKGTHVVADSIRSEARTAVAERKREKKRKDREEVERRERIEAEEALVRMGLLDDPKKPKAKKPKPVITKAAKPKAKKPKPVITKAAKPKTSKRTN